MTTAVILQARVSSTRLPGKVLHKVGGRTILEWMIETSKKIRGIEIVCVAIPDTVENDLLIDEAKRCGAVVSRGSEYDVLDRFRVAARDIGAKEIMRITTDCPMTDALINGQVLSLRRAEDADYACNNEPYSFPHGLDCEVFTAEALEAAAVSAVDQYDREHVTPWLKRNPLIRKAYFKGPGGEFSKWRLTVDYPEDLEFFRMIERFLGNKVSDWRNIAELLQAHPELHNINFSRRVR